MHIAIINEETNVVENVIVPPEGAKTWFCGAGFKGVPSESAGIGNIYNPETGEFLPDPKISEAAAKRIAEMSEAELQKEQLQARCVKIQTSIDALLAKEVLTIEEEGMLAMLENSLENVMMKLPVMEG